MKNSSWNILKFLIEDGCFSATVGIRPDSSGNRMGLSRPMMVVSTDKDDEDMYGQPKPYDRGSGGAGASHAMTLTPKDTNNTIWDEVSEAMGTPMNFTISGKGGSYLGSSIPGMSKGWGKDPIKPWDDEDNKVEIEAIMPPPFDPEHVDNSESPYYHDETDESLETWIDRVNSGTPEVSDPKDKHGGEFMKFPSAILVVGGSGFSTGLGNATKNSRDLYGIGWKENLEILPDENVWEELAKLDL